MLVCSARLEKRDLIRVRLRYGKVAGSKNDVELLLYAELSKVADDKVNQTNNFEHLRTIREILEKSRCAKLIGNLQYREDIISLQQEVFNISQNDESTGESIWERICDLKKIVSRSKLQQFEDLSILFRLTYPRDKWEEYENIVDEVKNIIHETTPQKKIGSLFSEELRKILELAYPKERYTSELKPEETEHAALLRFQLSMLRD